jgi:hypothetical protein
VLDPENAMQAARYERFDPVLPDGDAMLRLAERFGSYGLYNVESIEDDFGEGLTQRHDAAMNFVRTGGRFGRKEETKQLAIRTNYFRETYAYAEPLIEGVEPFLDNPAFIAGARAIHGREVIRPSIVYANILVPGQELALHTDVPEFRGINRTRDPQWLAVAMHHSGLFDAWRIPIATGVAWFGSCRGGGGEFCFYPEGPDAAPVALPVRHNTAILLDTDSVFHGVDRVSETRVEIPPVRLGMKLRFEGDGRWTLGDASETVALYDWDDLRFSISWKAYCYADAREERIVHEHSDDLVRAAVIERLVDDLRARGRIGATRPVDTELALTIIDEYIRFPKPAPPAAS